MIFQETWQLILQGKSQTRRPQKAGEILCTNIHGAGLMVRKNQRTLYEVGHSYAVQPGRGLPAVLYNPADLTVGGAVWDKARIAYLPTFRYASDVDYLMEYGFYERPAKKYQAWVYEFRIADAQS